MHLKSKSFLFILSVAVLLPVAAFAGWGDALKDAGTQIADQKAAEMGLPSTSETVAGVKEVLDKSATYAVDSLSSDGGFMENAMATIPMPDMLSGASGDTDGLLASMNTVAESLTSKSSGTIFNAIDTLSVSNPEEVVTGGGDDSITRFFESKSRPTIKEYMSPLVDEVMKQAGTGNYLDTFSSALSASGTSFDVGGYVTDKTLDGIFAMMADKEKNLRAAGGGASKLLQKLF